MQKRFHLLTSLLTSSLTSFATRFVPPFGSALSIIALGVLVLASSSFSSPSSAADMTFQFLNDNERVVSVKLFSRADSHQEWPSKTKFYSVKPNAAVQQLKISCEQGEQICWGAWIVEQTESGEIGSSGQRTIRKAKHMFGVGERGTRVCEKCCHICTPGAVTPVAKFIDATNDAK